MKSPLLKFFKSQHEKHEFPASGRFSNDSGFSKQKMNKPSEDAVVACFYKAFALLCVLTLAFPQWAISQEKTTSETLFKKGGSTRVGFFLEPGLHLSSAGNAGFGSISFRGGAVFNDRLSLGAIYQASVNDFRPEGLQLPNSLLDYRAAGMFLEYTVFSGKLIHATFPLIIGGVELDADSESDDLFEDIWGERNFILLEPGARLEINVSQNIRFNIGGSWRFTSAFNFWGVNQGAFMGPVATAGLKIGIF
jgi:hypothetical protein